MRLEPVTCSQCGGTLRVYGKMTAKCNSCGTKFSISLDGNGRARGIGLMDPVDIGLFFKGLEEKYKNVDHKSVCFCDENFKTKEYRKDLLKEILKVPPGEKILLVVDSTVFQSGKDGVIATNNGLWLKGLWEIIHITWEELANRETYGKPDDLLYVGDDSLILQSTQEMNLNGDFIRLSRMIRERGVK